MSMYELKSQKCNDVKCSFFFSSPELKAHGAYRMVLEPASVRGCVHIFKDLL